MRTQQLLLRVMIFLSLEPSLLPSQLCRHTMSAAAAAATTGEVPSTGSGEISAGKLRSMADEAVMSSDYTNAIAYLQQAIQIEPTSSMNYYKLYRIYYQRKRQRRDNVIVPLPHIKNSYRKSQN
jgi:tetratricopeptide (TPR) repeat protein